MTTTAREAALKAYDHITGSNPTLLKEFKARPSLRDSSKAVVDPVTWLKVTYKAVEDPAGWENHEKFRKQMLLDLRATMTNIIANHDLTIENNIRAEKEANYNRAMEALENK